MSLRMLWSMLTILLVAIVAVGMIASITEIEKQAWKNSEDEQARMLITMLSNQLKMPMVAVSKAEVDNLINMFMHEVPGTDIHLRWTHGETETFGDAVIPDAIIGLEKLPAQVVAVDGLNKWYAVGIKYNTTQLGSLAVYFPGESWRQNEVEITMHLTIVAAIVALLASLLVYGMSGRIVNQLRLLARASKMVGSGDFSVQLPIRSANEFGKAFHQFNKMVSSLEHREKVYDLYGRYQRPHLVADEFDRNSRMEDHMSREVSVLAADMMDFDGYMKACGDEDVIAVLNHCFKVFQQIVQEFGGHVDHVAGDRLFAIFNHPFDLKNHENQAAKAGMAMIEAVNKMALKRPDGGQVTFRIGMAIGEVAIGHLGVGRRKELTVVGAPVMLAAQLARIGDGSMVTAKYGTMLSLGHGFKQKDLGEKTLQGGSQLRCINILPGEVYVSQEIEAIVAKAFVQAEPDDLLIDEGW